MIIEWNLVLDILDICNLIRTSNLVCFLKLLLFVLLSASYHENDNTQIIHKYSIFLLKVDIQIFYHISILVFGI